MKAYGYIRDTKSLKIYDKSIVNYMHKQMFIKKN